METSANRAAVGLELGWSRVPGRRSAYRSIGLRAAVIVGVAGLVSCSGSGESSTERLPVDRVRDVVFSAFETNARASYLTNQVVATCMAEHGFEFTPGSLPDSGSLRTQFDLSDRRLTAEAAAEVGYSELLAADVETATAAKPGDEGSDTFGFSEAQLEAYARALYGDEDDEVLVELDDGGEMLLPTGCEGEAREEIFGEDGLEVKATLSEVGFLFGEVSGRMNQDERLVDVVADWRSCMQEAGYAFETVADAMTSAQDAFYRAGSGAAADGGATAAPVEGTDEFGADGEEVADDAESVEPGAAHVASQSEIDQAVADATCRRESSYYEMRDKVGNEIAADLLADREELILRLEAIREDVDERLRTLQ